MKRLASRTIDMLRKMTFALTLSVCIMGLYAQSLKTDEPARSAEETPAGKTAKKGKVSLAEAEPEVYYGLRGYSKFYGDDNTVHGDIFHRSQLLGNPMGLRDRLVEKGIYLDVEHHAVPRRERIRRRERWEYPEQRNGQITG